MALRWAWTLWGLAEAEEMAQAMRDEENWPMVGRDPHCRGGLRWARRHLKHLPLEPPYREHLARGVSVSCP